MIIHFDQSIPPEDVCPHCKFGRLVKMPSEIFIMKQCDFCEEWVIEMRKENCSDKSQYITS